jgi:hypothetical protein
MTTQTRTPFFAATLTTACLALAVMAKALVVTLGTGG